MIQVTGEHRGNVVVLEIKHPGNRIEYKTIYGNTPDDRAADALDYAYAIGKAYVCDKLISWLKSRQFALSSYNSSKSQEAAKLLVLLNYYHNFKFLKLCKAISDHALDFEKIAPAPDSNKYPYYQNIIAAILKECIKINALEQAKRL